MPNNQAVPEKWQQYMVSEEPSVPYEWSKYEIPSEQSEPQSQMDEGSHSLMGMLSEYLQGYAPGLLQAGAEGGRDVARAISYPARALYALAKDKPVYELPKADVMGFAPNTPAGQLGGKVGHGVGDLAMALIPLAKSAKAGSEVAREVAPKLASKGGDIAPILKSISSKPYKRQRAALAEKGLLGGYKPHVPDIIEGADLLKSPGMTIPHAAVDEAVAQTLEGNFEPWFGLQSSIRSEARRLSKKGGVHRVLGQRMHQLAEKMHGEMELAQAERGAPEAAEFMRQGKARSARYHKISPYAKLATGLGTGSGLTGMLAKILRETQR